MRKAGAASAAETLLRVRYAADSFIPGDATIAAATATMAASWRAPCRGYRRPRRKIYGRSFRARAPPPLTPPLVRRRHHSEGRLMARGKRRNRQSNVRQSLSDPSDPLLRRPARFPLPLPPLFPPSRSLITFPCPVVVAFLEGRVCESRTDREGVIMRYLDDFARCHFRKTATLCLSLSLACALFHSRRPILAPAVTIIYEGCVPGIRRAVSRARSHATGSRGQRHGSRLLERR